MGAGSGGASALFKFLSDPKNQFDAIIWDDTIKLGGEPAANIYNEVGDFDFSLFKANPDLIDAYTYSLDYKNWRHQIYTEHEVHKDRSVGVQIDREIIEGLAGNETIYEIDAKQFSGEELFQQWIDIHNNLIENQFEETKDRFGLNEANDVDMLRTLYLNMTKEYTLSIEDQMATRDIFERGTNERKTTINLNINASNNANMLLNSVSGAIGSDLLRIKLPGTEMIQAPTYGGVRSVYAAYKYTKQLRFRNENNEMEVAVGIEFFKHIIPNYKNMSYDDLRKEILSNPGKYTAYLYRIPSQGINFSANITIADILPAEFGAICIVPTGFTTASGSDNDSDKVYITSKYYELGENGEIVEIKYNDQSTVNSSMAMANRLVDIYRAVVSQNDGVAESTFPTDAQTAIVKDYILSRVEKDKDMFDYLTLNYSVDFHDIVVQGAAGLGASALAKSSHAIFTNFDISLSDKAGEKKFLEQLHLDGFSNIRSVDGIPIKDLLNVLISGFVDSVKNPFIFYSNINKYVLNAAIAMIRSGFGMATFALNLQPIIKDMNVYGGIEATAKEYIKKLWELNDGKSEDMPATSGEIWSYIEDNFIYKNDGTEDFTAAFKKLMTFKGLDNLLLHKDFNDPTFIMKQIAALRVFAIYNSVGQKLSDATRMHNIYSNSNTSSFYNIIEFLSTEEDQRPELEKYFTNYDKLFSDEFIFKKQVEMSAELLNELSRSGMIEFSGIARQIYKFIANWLPDTLYATSRRTVYKHALRALKLYFQAAFARNVMKELNMTPDSIIETIADDLINLKSEFFRLNIHDGELLLATLNPQEMNGKFVVKFDSMFAKDTSMKNALYAGWEQLFNNPMSRDFAIKLYLYSEIAGSFKTSGVNELSAFSPAALKNSLQYTVNGEVYNIDDYYDDIINNSTEVNMSRLQDFIISFASNNSDIVKTVGRAKGGFVVPMKKSGVLIKGPVFYSSFSPETPLTVTIQKTDKKMPPAVKIKFGKKSLVYHIIGHVTAKKTGKNNKVVYSQYTTYVLDTQPVVFDNDNIDFLNIDRNMYKFRTNNPKNTLSLLEDVKKNIPGGSSVKQEQYFDLRADVTSMDAVNKAYILKDAQDAVNESGLKYIIIDKNEPKDSVYGQAFSKYRDHTGKNIDLLAIVLRPTGRFNDSVDGMLYSDIQDLIRDDKFIAVNPEDGRLYAGVRDARKETYIPEKTEQAPKAADPVETKPKDVETKTGTATTLTVDIENITAEQIQERIIELGGIEGISKQDAEMQPAYMTQMMFGFSNGRELSDEEYQAKLEQLFNC
ncbi:hypothetical protein AGMMS50239_38560 [Bacteroidia bacterium]|nr:hypothetical protein AGMMS50239_38560 [Bacteroidia bacterium]